MSEDGLCYCEPWEWRNGDCNHEMYVDEDGKEIMRGDKLYHNCETYPEYCIREMRSCLDCERYRFECICEPEVSEEKKKLDIKQKVWLTLAPEEGYGVAKLQEDINKILKNRKLIKSGFYAFEWRKDDGTGLHAHLWLDGGIDKKCNKKIVQFIKRKELGYQWKKKFPKSEWFASKQDYVTGAPTKQTKIDKGYFDKQIREDLGLKDIYLLNCKYEGSQDVTLSDH